MPVKICPHCRSRFVTEAYCSDYVHTCNSGNNTLDQEDHFNIGTNPLVGMTNKQFGTTPSIEENSRLQSNTPRGNHVLTHTTRQRNVYLDFKKNLLGRNPIA